MATYVRICEECGTTFFVDVNGITFHYIEDVDDIDWDLDRDHVAYALDE